MINPKLIVLLTATILLRLTVFSQTSSNDSIKCFTYEQTRKITASIKKGVVCDSIAQNQSLQILNFKSIVRTSNEQLSLISTKLSDTERTLDKTMLKLKISKKLTTYGIPSALLGGFLIGILLKD